MQAPPKANRRRRTCSIYCGRWTLPVSACIQPFLLYRCVTCRCSQLVSQTLLPSCILHPRTSCAASSHLSRRVLLDGQVGIHSPFMPYVSRLHMHGCRSRSCSQLFLCSSISPHAPTITSCRPVRYAFAACNCNVANGSHCCNLQAHLDKFQIRPPLLHFPLCSHLRVLTPGQVCFAGCINPVPWLTQSKLHRAGPSRVVPNSTSTVAIPARPPRAVGAQLPGELMPITKITHATIVQQLTVCAMCNCRCPAAPQFHLSPQCS